MVGLFSYTEGNATDRGFPTMEKLINENFKEINIMFKNTRFLIFLAGIK